MAWRLVLRWYVSFMPLFARFVRGFVGLLLLSVIFYRCLAVAGFAFVVCGGFCALSGCFWRRFAFFNISVLIGAFCVVFRRLCGFSIVVFFSFAALVFFAQIFLHCWCPFLYFFLSLNVVCCVCFFLRLFFFIVDVRFYIFFCRWMLFVAFCFFLL